LFFAAIDRRGAAKRKDLSAKTHKLAYSAVLWLICAEVSEMWICFALNGNNFGFLEAFRWEGWDAFPLPVNSRKAERRAR
jgi:hypothetical protein